jgi:glycosyltransferase involved in cell wall biosynthesis
MIHYTEHPSGRKLDRLCNWLATDIIAISENVKTILVVYDRAKEKKIHTIHHGFDLQYFAIPNEERVCAIRKKYGINQTTFPIIGVIARYTKWKGIQFTIEAFSKIKVQYPDAHLLLANADGDFKETIQSMLQKLPEGSYTQIVFEEELSALYQLFNVYVHVPTSEQAEAFGQTYVEALAAGIPCVFTISGIAKEFIINEKNALVVEHQNSGQIANAINRILLERELRDQLRRNGFSAVKMFELNNMLDRLINLYEE